MNFAPGRIITYENPASTYANSTDSHELHRQLEGLGDVYPHASRHPRVGDNAKDLAMELQDNDLAIVSGGDATLRAVAEAAELSGVDNLHIVARERGGRNDGPYTLHGSAQLAGNGLLRLLHEGESWPVNAMSVSINDAYYGSAVSYIGVGLTAVGAEAANNRRFRALKRHLPGAERFHQIGQIADQLFVGPAVLRACHSSVSLIRNGEPVRVRDASWVNGSRMAGRLPMPGEALRIDNPSIKYHQITSGESLRSLIRTSSQLLRGELEFDDTQKDIIEFPEPTMMHLDGDLIEARPRTPITIQHRIGAFRTVILSASLAA